MAIELKIEVESNRRKKVVHVKASELHELRTFSMAPLGHYAHTLDLLDFCFGFALSRFSVSVMCLQVTLL